MLDFVIPKAMKVRDLEEQEEGKDLKALKIFFFFFEELKGLKFVKISFAFTFYDQTAPKCKWLTTKTEYVNGKWKIRMQTPRNSRCFRFYFHKFFEMHCRSFSMRGYNCYLLVHAHAHLQNCSLLLGGEEEE